MEAKGYEEEDLHVIGTKLFDSVRDTLLKQGVLQRMKVHTYSLMECVCAVMTRTHETVTRGIGAGARARKG